MQAEQPPPVKTARRQSLGLKAANDDIMNEKVAQILRLLARWGLNLSIALSALLLAEVCWWAVYACFVHPECWYGPATEQVNSYPESMEILRQLNRTDEKH